MRDLSSKQTINRQRAIEIHFHRKCELPKTERNLSHFWERQIPRSERAAAFPVLKTGSFIYKMLYIN